MLWGCAATRPTVQSVCSTPADARVAELAARQWGIASLEQLPALGLARGAIKHRLAVGRLHVVHRGVYAVGHTWRSAPGRGGWRPSSHPGRARGRLERAVAQAERLCLYDHRAVAGVVARSDPRTLRGPARAAREPFPRRPRPPALRGRLPLAVAPRRRR